jgi:hypothetical protein
MTRARLRSTASALLVCLALIAALAGAVGPASARDVRVRHGLYGVHDGSLHSFGAVHPGSIRLWDAGVQWQEIETSRHHYTWTRLDQLVTAAQAAHAKVTFVVAMTPHFYASSPTSPPRTVRPYKRFVRALMKRYRTFHGKRGISAYQVWNEANITTFWTGSMRRLVGFTRGMDQVRDRYDPHAEVIAPPMVTRLGYQQKGIAAYYGQRLNGVPVWRYVDAVALSLYPLPRYGHHAGVPEDSMMLLGQVRRILHRAGVPASKPIWNTEVNYGLNSGARGGTPAKPISSARQASNVVRTYLLNAANGVRRVFWYRYDMSLHAGGGTIGNTLLAKPRDASQILPAGGAYRRAQHWMHGTLVGTHGHRPCRHDGHGTYTCVVRDSSGTRHVYWNPFHSATVRLPRGVHHRQGVLGAIHPVTPRSSLKVGYRPVMVSR